MSAENKKSMLFAAALEEERQKFNTADAPASPNVHNLTYFFRPSRPMRLKIFQRFFNLFASLFKGFGFSAAEFRELLFTLTVIAGRLCLLIHVV